MKKIQPDYYDKFICVASACSYTCCQQWAIAVDADTKKKWKRLADPMDAAGEREHLSSHLCPAEGGGDKIRLNADRKCPLLDEHQLCHVVKAYGEETISQTCHTFPRECHRYMDREEYSLDIGCPEVLRLLWESDSFSLQETQDHGQMDRSCRPVSPVLLGIRARFMRLLAWERYDLATKWKMIFYLMLDMNGAQHLNAAYVDQLFADANLTELAEAIRQIPANEMESMLERNGLFLDLVQSYRDKGMYQDVLGKHIRLAEEIEEGGCQWDDGSAKDHKFSAYGEIWEHHMEVLMQQELYTSLLAPGCNAEAMVLKLQWLGLGLAVMKHLLFLEWKQQGALDEERVRVLFAVANRMLGYSDDEVCEYLENSFQALVWEWNYMSLIS